MQTSLQSDSVMRFFITTENLRGRLDAFSRLKALFERSELLIPTRGTSQKKIPSVCGCVCSTNLGFSVEKCLGFSVGYVLCTVCIWYQPAEITSCENHSMVVYIHEPYPWAQSVVARHRWRLRAGGREQWTVLSGTSTIGHGLHVADRTPGLTRT